MADNMPSDSALPIDILTNLTPAMLVKHGLNVEETETMLKILGRNPTLTELGIFSVMWSEHCSYKSSRKHLSLLPTTGECVICGPGENAGVIDIGGNIAAIFKMESHNHPSYIEPFQGAATGVGGILRDVFTMGARPVALLNALRFGHHLHPKTPHLLAGVVGGIGFYGNCMGVPTVAGETEFDSAYDNNILVNAMCVGIAKQDKIFYSKASGIGNPVIYVGAHTGRDGIHGATMASAEFGDDSEIQKPTVQVGDPFTEKRLLEACLELMQSDAVIAIQDMGAAGLTSSSVEMAGKGNLGIHLDLDRVPKREANMSGYELMLSESQERMLLVAKPDRVDMIIQIFQKWDLQAAIIGELNNTGCLSLTQHGDLIANIKVEPLSTLAPAYSRPIAEKKNLPMLEVQILQQKCQEKFNHNFEKPQQCLDALEILFAHPNFACKSWIWQQYDGNVRGHTMSRAGGDGAIIHIPENGCALALASDSNPAYVFADPSEGGKQIVAENWRNLTALGAKPLAITNNLNFASPENPEIMAQFHYALEGMKEACLALNYPVVSGNVSFYNETQERVSIRPILPTPVIGGVGLIADIDKTANMMLGAPDLQIYMIGETKFELGATAFEKIILGVPSLQLQYAPPKTDLALEKKHGDFVRDLIAAGRITICHDIAGGGMIAAIIKMLFHHKDHHDSQIGVQLAPPPDKIPLLSWLFSESQSRYIIACKQVEADSIEKQMIDANIGFTFLGKTNHQAVLSLEDATATRAEIALEKLYHSYQNTLPAIYSR